MGLGLQLTSRGLSLVRIFTLRLELNMKFELIDDIKDLWKFWSMWAVGMWSAIIAAWPMLAEEQRVAILGLVGVTPEQMGGIAALAMFVTITAARVAKQP